MREIRKLYLANFFMGFATVAGVTYTLFFLANGLTHYQISILFSVFMISMALFQIPTGGFADTYGQKTSLFLGAFVEALSFLIFFLSSSFNGFLVAMLVGALGLALQTGAYSSLLHELLSKIGKLEEFEKIYGRSFSFFEIAAIAAGPTGAYIFTLNHKAPYFLAFISVLLASLSVYLINGNFKKHENIKKVYFSILKDGFIFTIKNYRLVAFILIGIALTTSRLVMNQNINVPYVLKLGVDITGIGIIASAIAIITAVILTFSHLLSKKIHALFSLILMIVIPSLSMIILGYNQSMVIGIGFILIYYSGHAYRDIVLGALSQREAAPGQRSTIISTISFITSITAGLMLPFWGKSVDIFGTNNTLVFLGLFTGLIGLTSILIYKFNSHSKTIPNPAVSLNLNET